MLKMRMKLGYHALQLRRQSQPRDLCVSSRLIEIVTNMLAIPTILGRDSQKVGFQKQFNSDRYGVKDDIVHRPIRSLVSAIKVIGGIPCKDVGKRDVVNEAFGERYERRHGSEGAMFAQLS